MNKTSLIFPFDGGSVCFTAASCSRRIYDGGETLKSSSSLCSERSSTLPHTEPATGRVIQHEASWIHHALTVMKYQLKVERAAWDSTKWHCRQKQKCLLEADAIFVCMRLWENKCSQQCSNPEKHACLWKVTRLSLNETLISSRQVDFTGCWLFNKQQLPWSYTSLQHHQRQWELWRQTQTQPDCSQAQSDENHCSHSDNLINFMTHISKTFNSFIIQTNHGVAGWSSADQTV